jgi:hypothetical protein
MQEQNNESRKFKFSLFRAITAPTIAIACILSPIAAYANKWVDTGDLRTIAGKEDKNGKSVGGILGLHTKCREYNFPYEPRTAGLWCYDAEHPINTVQTNGIMTYTSPDKYKIYRSTLESHDIATSMVVFYEHPKKAGELNNIGFSVSQVKSIDDLSKPIAGLRDQYWNDRISAIRVPEGIVVKVCTDANFLGNCKEFTSHVNNLADHGMDNQISSIKVSIYTK